jgi:ketosteroid isomerase-like protein
MDGTRGEARDVRGDVRSDLENDFLPRLIAAEEALHRGDAGPRLALWSHRDPVSLFDPYGPCRTGWAEISEVFQWVAARFSGVEQYDLEIVALGVTDEMAYTVGFERSLVSVDGGPHREHIVRATHVYRREDGEWKVVHRHGDLLPEDESRSPSGG